MAVDLKLAGLASNFDWKSFVDQIMAVEAAPINRLNNEKATNISKSTALDNLGTKLDALQAAATALTASDLFGSRTVTSATAGSTWKALAATGTAAGSYAIAVSHLATAARRDGVADLGRALSTLDTGADLTLGTMPTAAPITAGTFTVNGHKVTVALTDTLEQVFTAIASATGGDVTATYDHTTDKVTLAGGGNEVVLGAANDTSNFLAALRLANNGLTSVSSTGKLGTLKTALPLASSRLSADLSALVAAGDSTFAINGVSIGYNVNTDSLSTVLKRINQSGAGVSAAYDGASDRVILTNTTTGDTGITVTDAPGGLMDALGLTGGSSLVRGTNAEFSVNGGPTLLSTSNTLDAVAHGIDGLSVTVDTVATQTLAVAGNTTSMRSAIEDFIKKFNDVQLFLDDQTKITSKDGKVTTALLADNREIQDWAHTLRKTAFAAVSGLSGTIKRLEHLGIDFITGSSDLEIKDGTKLDTALRDKADDVAEFFQTTSTGLARQLAAFTTKIGTQNETQQANLAKANTNLDDQIAAIQRRLDQQRALMESSFIRMEEAQSKIQSQSTTLTNAFKTTSSS